MHAYIYVYIENTWCFSDICRLVLLQNRDMEAERGISKCLVISCMYVCACVHVELLCFAFLLHHRFYARFFFGLLYWPLCCCMFSFFFCCYRRITPQIMSTCTMFCSVRIGIRDSAYDTVAQAGCSLNQKYGQKHNPNQHIKAPIYASMKQTETYTYQGP